MHCHIIRLVTGCFFSVNKGHSTSSWHTVTLDSSRHTAKCAAQMLFVVMHSAVQADDYFVTGIILALSLVHEGPAPAFLAKQLFDAVIGDPDKVVVPLTAIPESAMKTDLQQVRFEYFLAVLL